jgi:Tol biopolymer transport system component
MSTRTPDELDATLRTFLATRAADTAGMPTAADVAARVATRPTRRVVSRPALRPAWVLLLLAALISLVAASAFFVGHRGPPPFYGSLGTPANGWIAVAANRNFYAGADGDIYLLVAGAVPRRIIGSDGDGVAQACPAFSPDGRRIAYGEGTDILFTPRGLKGVAKRTVAVTELTERGDAGATILRSAPIPGGAEFPCPEWSPDGLSIAYRTTAGLWVADAMPGRTRSFAADGTAPGQTDFEWSRDGSHIAIAEPGAIRVVDVERATSTVIAVTGMTPTSLGWTAGDEQLIYVATDDEFGDRAAAHVVDADGRNDRPLAGDSAVVSPDGTRVAIAQSNGCTANGCSGRVLTMAPDGSAVTEVAVPSDVEAGVRAWSPDGERLLMGGGGGVVSVPVAPGSPSTSPAGSELDLEWTGSEVTWQPVFH